MYSFVAGAGLRSEQQRRASTLDALLRTAAGDVLRQLPALGAPLRIHCRELPEIDGGWATISPDPDTTPPLISDYCDATHAVLVFGEVDTAQSAAICVHDAFIKGGLRAVASLGGVFSVIVVERLQRRLHVVTSVPGCRSLRCRQAEGALVLAPTDLAVVALSRCDVQMDVGALATLVATGWPLGGGSAVKQIAECQPHETWTWTAGQVTVNASNPLDRGARLHPRDEKRIGEKVDEVIEELRSGVRHHLAYHGDESVTVPLTAGMDSRAVLGLILSVSSRERVSAYTRGTQSQDVRVARWLAAKVGIPHESRPSEPPSTADFESNARLLSVLTNGVSNAHTAARPRSSVTYARPVPLGGAGEVFRGFYYKYLWRQPRIRAGSELVVKALLAAPLKGLRSLRFAHPGLDEEAPRRLRQALAGLEVFSRDTYDLCDLFYIFERLGRWGGAAWRGSLGPSFVPFANHRAMAAAFELPAPIGDHQIVAHIIARFLPRSAYWMPVNGGSLLALEGGGALRRTAREALRISAKLAREARQRVLPGEKAPAKVRLDYLSKHMSELMSDTSRSSGSVARMLFTAEQIDHLLGVPGAGKPSAVTVAGALFSLELWKRALDSVRQVSRIT